MDWNWGLYIFQHASGLENEIEKFLKSMPHLNTRSSVMKTFRILFIISVAFAIFACAPANIKPRPQLVSKNPSTLYLVRDRSFCCMGLKFVAAVDGVDVVILSPGAIANLKIEPGQHEVSFRNPGYQFLRPRSVQKITAVEGGKNYVKITGNCGAGFIPFSSFGISEEMNKGSYDALIQKIGDPLELKVKYAE